MEQEKHIIDLFDTTESDKLKQKLQKDFFTAKPIVNEKPKFDAMAMGLKLMSKPKLIRNILIVVGILSATGLGFILYHLISYCILMIKNYYMTQIPLYQVVIIYALLKFYKKLGTLVIIINNRMKLSALGLKQFIKSKIEKLKNKDQQAKPETEIKPQI